jgi:hypothetical protein
MPTSENLGSEQETAVAMVRPQELGLTDLEKIVQYQLRTVQDATSNEVMVFIGQGGGRKAFLLGDDIIKIGKQPWGKQQFMDYQRFQKLMGMFPEQSVITEYVLEPIGSVEQFPIFRQRHRKEFTDPRTMFLHSGYAEHAGVTFKYMDDRLDENESTMMDFQSERRQYFEEHRTSPELEMAYERACQTLLMLKDIKDYNLQEYVDVFGNDDLRAILHRCDSDPVFREKCANLISFMSYLSQLSDEAFDTIGAENVLLSNEIEENGYLLSDMKLPGPRKLLACARETLEKMARGKACDPHEGELTFLNAINYVRFLNFFAAYLGLDPEEEMIDIRPKAEQQLPINFTTAFLRPYRTSLPKDALKIVEHEQEFAA